MFEHLGEYIKTAPLFAILISYIGGVLTSFTPCVFPVIPITIGVLGISESKSKAYAFFKAFVYVCGMAVVYAVLGIIASITGVFFGAISVHPITNIIVANICLVFALSMFDMIIIPIPSFLQSRKIAGEKHKNLLGVFVMGATSGTVVAPCTAPVLGTLLTYVGSTANVFYGAVLLFVFAFGLGTLLLIIGVFGSLITLLRKSDKLMLAIKKVLGFMMLLIAEYFLFRAGSFGY